MSSGTDLSAAARRHQGQPNRAPSQFAPKIPGIETLGTSTEQSGHDFAKFLKSIHHHALTTFRHSKDISKAIVEFTDPTAALRQAALSLSEIRRQNGLDPTPPVTDETETAKFLREADNADRRDEVKSLCGIQLKSLAEREKDLNQNLTIPWATIMGQCTPALQEETHGDPDYLSKSSTFDSVWLLQSLQKITAGVNKKPPTSTISLSRQPRSSTALSRTTTKVSTSFAIGSKMRKTSSVYSMRTSWTFRRFSPPNRVRIRTRRKKPPCKSISLSPLS
jgi:hypothetical protein